MLIMTVYVTSQIRNGETHISNHNAQTDLDCVNILLLSATLDPKPRDSEDMYEV